MTAGTTGKVFTGVRQHWLPLYRALKNRVVAAVGDFEEHPTSSAVVWKCGTSFAELRARQDALLLAFASDEEHPEWKPVKTLRSSKNRVVHYFELTGDEAFETMLPRIEAAYALAQKARPQSRGAKTEYATVEQYIAAFPPETRARLEKVRQTIKKAAPNATEKISWQMPTYHQRENLVHFAAQKNHLGFYPSPEGLDAFARQLAGYKRTKGGVQFPFAQPIPYKLIGDITRWRVAQVAGEQAGT